MTKGWNSLSAELLYASMEGGGPAEELAFYERRIRENGGFALDQACGTGRHLLPLIARGLHVHGTDISVDALAFAKRAAGQQGIEVVLFHQRMEECDIPHRYGTIYVANGTSQIIVDRKQAAATLRRFRKHLSPGRQLLIETFVPEEVAQGPSIHDMDHPIRWKPIARRGGKGEIVTTLWSESVDQFEQTPRSKRRYDLLVDGKRAQSEEHAHPVRWYFHYEFEMMLENAGFVDIRTYSDYTDRAATKETKTVLFGARRPDR